MSRNGIDDRPGAGHGLGVWASDFTQEIVRRAQKCGVEENTARDLAQEVMIKVSKSFDPTRGPIDKFTFKVARHVILDHLRRKRRFVVLPAQDIPAHDPVDTGVEADTENLLGTMRLEIGKLDCWDKVLVETWGRVPARNHWSGLLPAGCPYQGEDALKRLHVIIKVLRERLGDINVQ